MYKLITRTKTAVFGATKLAKAMISMYSGIVLFASVNGKYVMLWPIQ